MKFRHLLYFSLTLVGLLFLSLYLVENPGQLVMTWQDHEIHMSMAFFVFSTLIFFVAFYSCIRLILLVFSWPRLWRDRQNAKRETRSLSQLTQSMIALANGDHANAQKLALKASTDQKALPLKTFLLAQSAYIAQNDFEAKKQYAELLDFEETRLYALQQLSKMALQNGQEAKAIEWLHQAEEIAPKASWIYKQKLDLFIQTQQWDSALKACHKAREKKAISQDESFSIIAAIYCQFCQQSLQKGHDDLSWQWIEKALYFTRKFVTKNKPFAPAYLLYVHCLQEQNQHKKALKIIEEAWRTSPNPHFIEALHKIQKDKPTISRFDIIKKLTAQNPLHSESIIALMQAYYDENLWGKARQTGLDGIENGCQDTRLFELMKKIEIVEFPETDTTFVQEKWQEKAKFGTVASWSCQNCGTIYSNWQAVCSHCHSFKVIDWQSLRSQQRVMKPNNDNILPFLQLEEA